jgi:molecular chaperone GrpE
MAPFEDTERVEEAAAESAAVDETAAAADPPADAEVIEETPEEQAAAELVEEDLAELQKKAAERDEYLALAQRTQADFENFRKRMARDVSVARERGAGTLAKEIFPALDSLARAVEAAGDDGSDFANGVRLVQSELAAGLGRAGIERFDPKGEAFDPEHHEAIAQTPVDGAQSGTIVEVYQAGYRLNDTVLRPAKVVVAA